MKPSSPSSENSLLSSDSEQPAFGVAEGVFPFHADGGLDLPSLPCEVTEVYRAEQGASFSHHSALMVFKDHLYCSWSSGMEAEDAVGQSVSYRRTADGKTWSDLRRMVAPEGNDRLVSAGFLVSGDTLVAYHTRVREHPVHNLRQRETALYAMTSRDGETWSQPVRVAGGFFIEGPLRLPGGRLIMGGENVGLFDEHKVRMRMLYSDEPDGLSGWKEAEIHPERSVPKGVRIFDYTECCPFVRPDGVLVAPFRNYSTHLYASISRDQGASWSVPVETNFPDSMARFSTGTLPDGTTWIINNPGPNLMNRSRLTLALSRDGRVFDRAWLLRSEPTAMRFPGADKVNGWQYPSAKVWGDSLYISYSVNKEDVLVSRVALAALGVRGRSVAVP